MNNCPHYWVSVWSNFHYGLQTTRVIYFCPRCDEYGYSAPESAVTV